MINLKSIKNMYGELNKNKEVKSTGKKIRHTQEFKDKVLLALKNRGNNTKTSVANKYNISPMLIYTFEKALKCDSLIDNRKGKLNIKATLFELLDKKTKLSESKLSELLSVGTTTIYRWKKEYNQQ